eukprot:8804326-Karenia_brevis.AAC.1
MCGSCVKKRCVWADTYDSPESESDSVETQERQEGVCGVCRNESSDETWHESGGGNTDEFR